MSFEVFKRQRAASTDEPAITIQKRGAISINLPAYELLGSPEHLELLYDREENLIGLRKADSTVPHAYAVRPLGKSGNTHVVSGRAFLAWYGVETGIARRWIATMRDDTLIVDLKQPGAEVTGNRGVVSR